ASAAAASTGGSSLALLDNALDNALKLLKESRAASSAKSSSTDSDSQPTARFTRNNKSNVLTLTPLSKPPTQSISVAFSSKSKYNNSLNTIDVPVLSTAIP